MLRKIRIAAALLFFVLITLLFLDFTGTLHAWFGWMAKIQFLPALLAVVTQLLPYIGYPRTLNAIGCLNEVLPE